MSDIEKTAKIVFITRFQAKPSEPHFSNGKGGFSQAFVKTAPVILVMVIDFQQFGSQDDHAKIVTCVDAGNVSENINLYCQSVGLVTVPRAIMDSDGIRQLLGLSDKQFPVMNNPVGHPKK